MVPDFAVTIEGVPLIAPILKSILSVSVTQYASGTSSFSMQINDPTFQLSDIAQGIFSEGKRVEIFMGYVGRTQSMIKGEISAVSVELEESGGLTLSVQGFDRLHSATRGTPYRKFRVGQTDSEIVAEIASNLQLTPSVDVTKPRTDQQTQNNQKDLEYLEKLAEANEFYLWADGDVLNFKKERSKQQTTVTRGRDLISFWSRLSTSGQVGNIEVRGTNPSQKTFVTATAESGQNPAFLSKLSITGQMQVNTNGAGKTKRVIYPGVCISSIDEAKNLAEAMMNTQHRDLLEANGSAVGNPELCAGGLLILENMGRFSGVYVIKAATHEIGASGYRTSFELRCGL